MQNQDLGNSSDESTTVKSTKSNRFDAMVSFKLDPHDINSQVKTKKYITNANPGLRKGKWSEEEENYTTHIIHMFNSGTLPIESGTTLRSYLSEKLNCDPMRITKKFAGAASVGKVVFQPTDSQFVNNSIKDTTEDLLELKRLETIFYNKLYGHKGKPVKDDSQASVVSKKLIPAKGMKKIMSAPNFSQLSTLGRPFSSELSKHEISDQFYPKINNDTFSKKRSQSVINLLDYEHYVENELAASNLLLMFSQQATHENSRLGKNNSIFEVNQSNAIPFTINQTRSSPIVSTRDSNSFSEYTETDIGLNIDDGYVEPSVTVSVIRDTSSYYVPLTTYGSDGNVPKRSRSIEEFSAYIGDLRVSSD